jgi:hypothetical protein
VLKGEKGQNYIEAAKEILREKSGFDVIETSSSLHAFFVSKEDRDIAETMMHQCKLKTTTWYGMFHVQNILMPDKEANKYIIGDYSK